MEKELGLHHPIVNPIDTQDPYAILSILTHQGLPYEVQA